MCPLVEVLMSTNVIQSKYNLHTNLVLLNTEMMARIFKIQISTQVGLIIGNTTSGTFERALQITNAVNEIVLVLLSEIFLVKFEVTYFPFHTFFDE